MKSLKHKIQSHLTQNHLPTYLFEDKINVSRSVIGRILDNSIKNPTLDTLIKIADGINCSLDELIGRKIPHQGYEVSNILKDLKIHDSILFLKCVQNIIDALKLKDYIVTLEQMLYLIEETYNYTCKKNISEIDLIFVDWLIDKTFRD